MRNARQQLVGWAVMIFVIGLLACAGGLVMIKVLPPMDSARIMSKLPAPLQEAVNALLFPHPDFVPTPVAQPVKNVAALLTPMATHRAPTTGGASPLRVALRAHRPSYHRSDEGRQEGRGRH